MTHGSHTARPETRTKVERSRFDAVDPNRQPHVDWLCREARFLPNRAVAAGDCVLLPSPSRRGDEAEPRYAGRRRSVSVGQAGPFALRGIHGGMESDRCCHLFLRLHRFDARKRVRLRGRRP